MTGGRSGRNSGRNNHNDHLKKSVFSRFTGL
nr:MAG TPA: hypothetical protein [Caudoviricetes sp.]